MMLRGIVLMATLLASPLLAAAEEFYDYLSDASVAIVRHKRNLGTRIVLPDKLAFNIPGRFIIFDDSAPPTQSAADDTTTTVPFLAECSESQVRREQVGSGSPMTFVLDAVFFDADNERHRQLSEKLAANPVPYKSGARLDLSDPNANQWPTFAAALGIFCLPTRFHFVRGGEGETYMEYREGSEAWVEE